MTVQMNIRSDHILTNIHKTLRMFPNLVRLNVNSQLEGKIECEETEMKNLTTLKVDFTCTDEQCENMYRMVRKCPNLKVLELNSRLTGKLEVEGAQMEKLESLTVMGIAENAGAFKNLTTIMKISPNLKKIDFWIRGNSTDHYFYRHSDEILKMPIESFDSIEEVKIWRYHRSEYGILSFLSQSCRKVKNIEWNMTNNDMNHETLEKTLKNVSEVEELSFGKDFALDAQYLTIIKENLKKLKKMKLFAQFPLEMQKIVKNVFGETEIVFVYNPNCLEEWEEDEISKV